MVFAIPSLGFAIYLYRIEDVFLEMRKTGIKIRIGGREGA